MVTNDEFVPVLNKFQPLINKFARKFSFNETQREDVKAILASELFLAMEKHDAQKSNFLTYVHNRFRWACLNQIKSVNEVADYEKTLPEQTDKDKTFSTKDNQKALLYKELMDNLRGRLDHQSLTVLTHLQEGKNMRETGEILDLSEQRISQIFQRICDRGHKISGEEKN